MEGFSSGDRWNRQSNYSALRGFPFGPYNKVKLIETNKQTTYFEMPQLMIHIKKASWWITEVLQQATDLTCKLLRNRILYSGASNQGLSLFRDHAWNSKHS